MKKTQKQTQIDPPKYNKNKWWVIWPNLIKHTFLTIRLDPKNMQISNPPPPKKKKKKKYT